jgi:aspartate aminotransferase
MAGLRRAPEPSRLVGELELTTRRRGRTFPDDVIRLDNGNPDFPPPAAVCDVLRQHIVEGATRYGPAQGIDELRDRLAAEHAVSSGRVLVTHGAAAAIFATFAAVINPGDRVVIPSPTYSIFPDAVRFVGGVPVLVPTTADRRLDLERLADAAREARMLVICNPCNPTGVVYTRAEIAAVVELSTRHDLLVMADEVYSSIVFDETPFCSLTSFPELTDRLFYVQSFSKTFAMAGLRLGYLIAPTWCVAACLRAHRTVNLSVSRTAQLAAVAALSQGQEWLADALVEYHRRRATALDAFAGLDCATAFSPEGTLFTWVEYRLAISSDDLAEAATAHGVSIRPGSEFGPEGEGHFSFALAVGGDAFDEALRRLTATLQTTARRGTP